MVRAVSIIHPKLKTCVDRPEFIIPIRRHDFQIGNSPGCTNASNQPDQCCRIESDILEADVPDASCQCRFKMDLSICYRPIISGQHKDEVGAIRCAMHSLLFQLTAVAAYSGAE